MKTLLPLFAILFSFQAFASNGSIDLENNADFQQAMKIAEERDTNSDYTYFEFEPYDNWSYIDCRPATPSEAYQEVENIPSQVEKSPNYEAFKKIMINILSNEQGYTLCVGGTLSDGGSIDELFVFGDEGKIRFMIGRMVIFEHF